MQKNCCESAILIAREHQISWGISDVYITYAELLMTMRQYTRAHEYLAKVLSHEKHPPVVMVRLAEVGIPLALHLNDTALLARCELQEAISLAFQSGNPTQIAEVAAAFAELYAHRGMQRQAQALLRRAVRHVRRMEGYWKFPISVARFGDRHTIRHTHAFLEQRAALPYGELARATLTFFEALVARRSNKTDDVRKLAFQAAYLFKKLGWYPYLDEAHRMAEVPLGKLQEYERETRLLAGFEPGLTQRESQVVKLVLRGYTNRKISDELGISENTVEKHMASIMGRLGIRSRHQISTAFGSGTGAPEGTDSVMYH